MEEIKICYDKAINCPGNLVGVLKNDSSLSYNTCQSKCLNYKQLDKDNVCSILNLWPFCESNAEYLSLNSTCKKQILYLQVTQRI